MLLVGEVFSLTIIQWQRLLSSYYLTSLVFMIIPTQISWNGGQRAWIIWEILMHKGLIWHTPLSLTFCWPDRIYITTLDASESGKCGLPLCKLIAISLIFTILVKKNCFVSLPYIEDTRYLFKWDTPKFSCTH